MIFALLSLLLFAAIVLWRSNASKRRGLLLPLLLGFGVLMLAGLLLMWFYSSAQHPLANRVTNAKNSSHASQITTERMWQHLNRPRIDLAGEDAKQESAAEGDGIADLEPTRPAWVDLPPKQIGNVYRVAISSGPYKTKPECYHALEMLLGKEVQQRIKHLMPDAKIPDPAQLGITTEYILQEICNKNKTWVETTEASFGKMKQVHVQMEFTAATEKHLQNAFRNHKRQDRVQKVGGIAGLGLGGLALLYGLLRWTPRSNA